MTKLAQNALLRVTAISCLGISIFAAAVSASGANTLYNTATAYAESKTVTTCGVNASCVVVFRKVASTKTLMITHVSCRIVAKSTAAPLTRAVLTDSGGQPRESLTPILLATDGADVQYFQSSNETSAVFSGATAAVATPQVSVTFDGGIEIDELSCSLAGHYL